MRTLQELVALVEQLKADNTELKARFNAHAHTVAVTYDDYDGGVPTNRTATVTVTTPR